MLNVKLMKVLFLAPHTDDAELGCGGTLSRFLNEGATVHVVAFSSCKESLNEMMPEDTLANEFFSAMKSLDNQNLTFELSEFPVRNFEYVRQDILDFMIEVRNRFEPDIIFVPSSTDIHQDHQVIHNEGVRAFKNKTILGYELPWNHISSKQNLFISLSPIELDNKVKLLNEYVSQKKLGRKYFKANFMSNLAEFRGAQVGMEAAESFEIIRMTL
jgi:N-acetylglucosamine malate deacetylase 1